MLVYPSTSRCNLQKQSSVSAADCTRTQTVCRHVHEAFWQLLIGFCCFGACHQTFFINFRFSTRTVASRLLLFMGCNFLLTICCNTSECEFFMNKYVVACFGCRFDPVVAWTYQTPIAQSYWMAPQQTSTSSQEQVALLVSTFDNIGNELLLVGSYNKHAAFFPECSQQCAHAYCIPTCISISPAFAPNILRPVGPGS